MEAGRMITCIMTSESSSKKPVIMLVISRPFRFLPRHPGHRRKPSAYWWLN